jgi:predicted amidohydrolase
MLKLAAITTGPGGGAIARLLIAAEGAVADAAADGARLVVLPELFALPYVASDDPVRWRHLAERLDGPTALWAAELARALGISLVFGMALIEGPDPAALPFNAAVLATPAGALRVVARKTTLPPTPPGGFGEADHFRPGAGAPHVFTLEGVRVATIICYDRRYPECWRAALDAGADLVAVLVAGPAPGDPEGIYEAELRTHARANALFVAAAARSGTERLLARPVTHDGASLTIDFDGRIVDVAPRTPGATAFLAITPEALAAARVARLIRTLGRSAYATDPVPGAALIQQV